MESVLNNSIDLNVSSSSSLSMSNENNMISNGNLGDDNYMNGATQVTAMSSNGRENRFFSDYVVDILNRWFMENHDYPYPDEYTTEMLAKEANISAKQVRKWFANKRVRSNKCAKHANRNLNPKKKMQTGRDVKKSEHSYKNTSSPIVKECPVTRNPTVYAGNDKNFQSKSEFSSSSEHNATSPEVYSQPNVDLMGSDDFSPTATQLMWNPYVFVGLQRLAMVNRQLNYLKENVNVVNERPLTSLKTEPTAVNSFKRKTHLSNCFLNDLSRDAKQVQTVNHPDDVYKPATSTYKFSERLLQLSLSTSLSSSLSSSSSSSPVHDSSYSPQYSPTEQQQQQPDIKLNQQVFPPRKKINFGLIDDLIS